MMNKEFRKILETASSTKVLDYLKSNKEELDSNFRLKYIYSTILSLLDFKDLIDAHKKELKLESHQISIKAGFNPSDVLNQYIILEINSFYDICELEKINLSKIPQYSSILKKFRNKIPGHRDKNKQLKDMASWMQIHKQVDDIGMPKILNDFKEYAKEILKEEGR